MSDESRLGNSSEMNVEPTSSSKEPQFTSNVATATAEENLELAQTSESSNVGTSVVNEQVDAAIVQSVEGNASRTPSSCVVPSTVAGSIRETIEAEDHKRVLSPSSDEAPSKKIKTNSNEINSDQTDAAAVQSETKTTSNETEATIESNNDTNVVTAPPPSGEDTSDQVETGYENVEPSVAELIRDKLEPITEVTPLQQLSLRDLAELENSLQLGDKYDYSEDDSWCKDWSGNLQLFQKKVIANQGYANKYQGISPIKIHFYEWAAKNPSETHSLRGLELLLTYVCHTKGCPEMAQRILAHAIQKPAIDTNQRLDFILNGIRRTTYDPIVLEQDGWTTKKAETPEGPMGGANLIGTRVIWQGHEAIVCAFTLDETWGSLWKAIWVEDLETFDMEADELSKALTKYEKKQARLQKKSTTVIAGATRKQATARFLVDGIEHGIVLALPSKGNTKGQLWPARVMHVSEIGGSSGSRRNSAPTKAQIQVVFLAPFWNGSASAAKAASSSDPFSLGPYFEIDTIDVADHTLKKYPFDSFSIEDFKSHFRFLCLPSAVLSRYLDANRLAMALKTYAKKHIPTTHLPGDEDSFASALLTGSHVMSTVTPLFPPEVLAIPFDYILKQLPRANEHVSVLNDNDDSSAEVVVDIKTIVDAMKPPLCFGKKQVNQDTNLCLSPERSQRAKMLLSPNPNFTPMSQDSEAMEEEDIWSLNNFASELLMNLFETSQTSGNHLLCNLAQLLNSLLMQMKELSEEFFDFDEKKQKKELFQILRQCLLAKGHGEDVLASSPYLVGSSKTNIIEWRKCCERMYKRAVQKLKLRGAGNGHTSVLSDSRCNGHITAENAFERPVRLPAALRGAKQAGAGRDSNVSLVTSVEDLYVSLAEEKIIPKAHQKSYIKRLKATIAAIPDDQTGVQLTDNSEDEGGDDTKGSRGSWTAATVAVGAALMAVDQVVGGQVVNAFCAVRPPGHHAGRELHPMKAVSNGFCLFNAAACAAIYATTPQSQGGLGLRRVCVIDFDLHHGNGTQDILCNTHDPRFLYVSWHVGGAHINGYDEEEALGKDFHLPGQKTTEGIFPGRCGDTNPHDGVLNIPLGSKVKSNDVGTALVSQVLPRVESFSPDLIILSAGFDAHVNDPLGMGGLTAADFGHVTEVACQIAYKTCSGRILSVLEGGYGVPCCAPRTDLFLPNNEPEKLLDLGDDLPEGMPDPVTNALMRQKLNKCHAEGFIECVKEHVKSFVKFNKRKERTG